MMLSRVDRLATALGPRVASMLRAGLLFALAGCNVGEVPVNADSGGEGAASFEASIAPLVTECVAAGACHTVQAPVLTWFQSLAARYKAKPGVQNILVTKGSLTGGTHSGLPYLTTMEQATVAAWIDSL